MTESKYKKKWYFDVSCFDENEVAIKKFDLNNTFSRVLDADQTVTFWGYVLRHHSIASYTRGASQTKQNKINDNNNVFDNNKVFTLFSNDSELK